MKVTFSIWCDKNCNITEEHVIDSWAMHGIADEFREVIELRQLRCENHALRTQIAAQEPKP